MTKVQENAKATLRIIYDVDDMVQALDWGSGIDALHHALDGVDDLLYVASNRNDEGVPGTDWELNAMIDNITGNMNPDKKNYSDGIKKIEKYLEAEAKD